MSSLSEFKSAQHRGPGGQGVSGRADHLRLLAPPTTVGARVAEAIERASSALRPRLDAGLKRGVDVVGAGLALLCSLPLLVIIAVAIKVSSPGPVVFGHARLGRDGKPFRCLKFRTMVPDADRRLAELFEERPDLRAYFEEHFKLPADPRVTEVGRLLRRTSLDELPQLINVLRGDMSLVGPRPIVTDEQAKYGQWCDTLFSVRPGITGLWQVSGRSDLDYDTRVDLDVSYIQDRSLRGDLAILLRTVRVVLSVGHNGAY